MAARYRSHCKSPSLPCPDIEECLDSLRRCMSDFADSNANLKLDIESKLSEIETWVTKQNNDREEKLKELTPETVGKVLKVVQVTVNSIEKFKSDDPVDIAVGVLNIVSSIGSVFGGPYGPIITTICGIIGTILSYGKPKHASVVDQLAKVVHKELVNFNQKLHDQRFQGLKDRVCNQTSQLRTLKSAEKLDDTNLWNDYVQFMGELSNRLESPLPFTYEKKSPLTKDPDVADFVTAVVTYSEAYVCFMALLLAANGRFADLGRKEDEDVVYRIIKRQEEKAREKLAFLSDEKYLTFLGRLPYEGGKLTKIVVLSRNTSGKRLVEAVRRSLDLSQLPDSATVESKASKVSSQCVKLKLEGHGTHSFQNSVFIKVDGMLKRELLRVVYIEFINETDFPMKIVSGKVGWNKLLRVTFTHDVQSRSSFWLEIPSGQLFWRFSSGGYIILYQNGILSSEVEPPASNVRVIEFALSSLLKINIQDKTSSEFTSGQDTYDKMNSGTAKTLYWFNNGEHFMARAEITGYLSRPVTFRFVVQDYDPLAVSDYTKTGFGGLIGWN